MVRLEEEVHPRSANETKVGPAKRAIPVMIVDNEEDIREVMCALLKTEGYTVTAVEGGPMALKLVQDSPGAIDLLITDIRMPEMDGIELALRMKVLRPEIKVLFMSAFAGDLFVSGQIRPGHNFLAKPFSGVTLVEKLPEIL